MDDALNPAAAHNLELVRGTTALARRGAEILSDHLWNAIERRGRALFALAGGSTPRATYTALTAHELPWPFVDFVWGDERMVDDEDPASNVRMARETLLEPLGIEGSRIHAPRTDLRPEEAALEYEKVLRALDPRSHPPRLDVVLLGMGPDGHTASLFPGGPELEAPPSRLMIDSISPFEPRERISLTLRMLIAARHVVFLVGGADKRDAVSRVLAGDPTIPATHVVPVDGTLQWVVDRDALDEESSR